MKPFADLFDAIDSTTSTNAKVDAMAAFFTSAAPADAAWAVYFLTGRKLKRLVSYANIRRWAKEESQLPDWLFSESHATVGDLAETISLVLDTGSETGAATDDAVPLAEWVETRLLTLRGLDPSEQRARITQWWRRHDRRTVFLINKLMTGALRVGVSRGLVVRALAQRFDLDPATVTRRIQGEFEPSENWFRAIGAPPDPNRVEPAPFFLASPVEGAAEDLQRQLGDANDFIAEYKWDGIRAQAVRNGDETLLWSRGEEPVTDAFPEITRALARLPDRTVLDGELLAHDGDQPLPFATLQKRLGRKAPGRTTIARYPVVFMAYDLLADQSGDRTADPIGQRRADLEQFIAGVDDKLLLSPIVEPNSWAELESVRAESRERRVEGLMLKRRGSPYRAGRVRGDWWKWKIDPYTLDLVLTYAQPGRGRRANLLTDYTFSAWDKGSNGDELVTLTKAYSGLDQQEIAKLDKWIRAHTTERFGPVRQVEPQLVFELAFEGLQHSDRHASGVALRFPRIARWRTDLSIKDADTMDTVRSLLGPDPNPRTDPNQGLLPGF